MAHLRTKQRKSLKEFRKSELIHLDPGEVWLLVCKTSLVLGALDYFFYREGWMLLPLLPVGSLFWYLEQQELVRRKKEQVREQFTELLQLTTTFQRAGYSVENAFMDSYDDMERLYGEKSVICKVLMRFAAGRRNHCPFGELWHQTGEELAVAEIRDFAEIYELAYHHSGNLTEVMEETSLMITESTALQKEIILSVAARKTELQIMTVTPFAILLYIEWTSPGYFDMLYHNPTGKTVMTVVLLLYLAGYVWAYRISRTDVKSRKKRDCLKEIYPEFVEKLRLYLTAGLTMRNAFTAITALYAGQRESDRGKQYLLKELRILCNQLKNGANEEEAYVQWGNDCGDRHYRRLGFLLSVNLKKGNTRLLYCLEREVTEMRNTLHAQIRKRGEQASVQLLFPMILYLIVVMILVIYPAYQRLGGV